MASPPGPSPGPQDPRPAAEAPHSEDELAVDDGYESDGDSTASLRSAIFEYVYENGRRYHNPSCATYWGPNDDEAQNNLDLFHHIFNMSFGGRLFVAPIAENPQNVLDLGTGTGIWALDFADLYPSAVVVATDVSPIQPAFVPPNLHFQIDDMEAEWTFRPDHFDFIHARCIYGSVADYVALYRQALKHLKPGAWFQQAEISVVPVSDDGTTEGSYLEQWGKLAIQAGESFGKSFSIAEDMKDLMAEAGLVNVTCQRFKWPIGSWPRDPVMKDIGTYNRIGWDEGLEGWAMMLFTKFLGWQPEEVQVLLAKIRREIRQGRIHAYQYIYVCYGQRPEAPKAKGATAAEAHASG